jgi:hypothetical protein
MPDRLPDIRNEADLELAPKLLHRAARDTRRAELELYRYQLNAAVRREKDIIDTEVLEDVFTAATDSELKFMSEFRAKAGNSAAAIEVVARKMQMLDDITNRRIMRRFGR